MPTTIDTTASLGVAKQATAPNRPSQGQPLSEFKTMLEEAGKTVRTKDDQILTKLETTLTTDHDLTRKDHMREATEQSLEIARKMLDYWQQNHPDSSSNIRTVFSQGDTVLASVDRNGYLVSNDESINLRQIANRADDMGLTGESRIDYMTREVEKTLGQRYPNMQMEQYDRQNMPTKRAFNSQWYPEHDTDGEYNKMLANARSDVAKLEEMYRNL